MVILLITNAKNPAEIRPGTESGEMILDQDFPTVGTVNHGVFFQFKWKGF